MLVRFSVENYRSFKKRQVFSMAAGKNTRHKEQIVSINGKRLLKAGILFGANAAGKSNLIKAVNFSRNVALQQDKLLIAISELMVVQSTGLVYFNMISAKMVISIHMDLRYHILI